MGCAMKTAKCGIGKSWSRDALAELHRVIDEERDSARWLKMSRALANVEVAIDEADKVALGAVAAERRLARRARRV